MTLSVKSRTDSAVKRDGEMTQASGPGEMTQTSGPGEMTQTAGLGKKTDTHSGTREKVYTNYSQRVCGK